MPVWHVANRTAPNPLQDTVMGGLKLDKGEANFGGAAVWKGRQMAGWLTPEETSILTFLMRLKQPDDFLISSGAPGVAMRIAGGRSNYWTDWDPDGTVVLHVRITTRGDLVSSDRPVITPADQAAVSDKLAGVQRDKVSDLLRHLQGMGSDPLGFGERLRRVDSTAPEVQDQAAWLKAYAGARISIDSNVVVDLRGYSR